MPGIAPHMVVAKLVKDELKIESNDIYKGALLPDIIKGPKKESHFKKQQEYFEIPDIEYYKKTHKLNTALNIGYYTHLALDKYYLEDYITKSLNNVHIFDDKKIYLDYDYINYELVEKYHLDVNKLNKILVFEEKKVSKEKLQENKEKLKNKSIGNPQYIILKEFETFLETTAKKITNQIKDAK